MPCSISAARIDAEARRTRHIPLAADVDRSATLHPEAPDIAAQVLYARAREWACTDEDVLVRRTTLSLRGLKPAADRLPA